MSSIGVPDTTRALLFDMDGVLTKTAVVHAKAWQQAFDEFLASRGDPYEPFDPVVDYDEYVDGKPRADGVRSFLQARGISFDDDLVRRIGDHKNDLVQALIRRDGVEAYEGSRQYLDAAVAAGLSRAVVSSSANTREVLVAAGLDGYFQAEVDGIAAAVRRLKGKPAPDTFLAAARELGVEPAEAVVFEDALAGVEAGHAGKFGFVVGVDRVGQADALLRHGASIVVKDLADLL